MVEPIVACARGARRRAVVAAVCALSVSAGAGPGDEGGGDAAAASLPCELLLLHQMTVSSSGLWPGGPLISMLSAESRCGSSMTEVGELSGRAPGVGRRSVSD